MCTLLINVLWLLWHCWPRESRFLSAARQRACKATPASELQLRNPGAPSRPDPIFNLRQGPPSSAHPSPRMLDWLVPASPPGLNKPKTQGIWNFPHESPEINIPQPASDGIFSHRWRVCVRWVVLSESSISKQQQWDLLLLLVFTHNCCHWLRSLGDCFVHWRNDLLRETYDAWGSECVAWVQAS